MQERCQAGRRRKVRESRSRGTAYASILTYPALLCGIAASAQQLPSAPSTPWQPLDSLHLSAPREAAALPPGDTGHQLSLAELIELAEQRNPETRAAWERAREAAALKGVARAALIPTLTGLVLGQTTRTGVLINSSFVRQTEGLIEPALELDYIVFDWNERLDALRAARYDLFASDFAFNDTHLRIIDQVASSYYRLLNNQGQVAAAEANLANAQAVSAQVEARLANGLATLPDALEARADAAQATYQLTSLKGAQSIAQADLATTLRLPASTTLAVVPLDQLASSQALADTAADAAASALGNRPELLEQETRIRAADQRIRQARTAYLPQIDLTANWGRVRAFGEQDLLPSIYAASGVWNAQLNLHWTLSDGGLRASQIAQAIAIKATAQSELDADRDRIEDQVWTAYTNTQTAIAEQSAADALLSASQASYQAATEAYADGVRTLVDVITAERTLAQARSEEVTARTNVFQQATDLAFRTGDLLRTHPGPAGQTPGTVSAPVPRPSPGTAPAPQAIAPNGAE
jgi:outer membrane protein